MRDNQAQVINDLFRELNGAHRRMSDAITEHIRSEHPTLTQNFVRHFIRPSLEAIRNLEYTDARDEASKRWAIAALEATKDIGLPYI